MADPLPDFGTYLITNLMADVRAEVAPDAQAVLNIVIGGGAVALLDPANALTVQSFLLKLQADAMRAGNDLSKQVATYVSLWLAAKFPAAKP